MAGHREGHEVGREHKRARGKALQGRCHSSETRSGDLGKGTVARVGPEQTRE